MRRFKCSVCGYIYDESAGVPGQGITPGTTWEDLPEDFVCPLCMAPKGVFKLLEEAPHPDAGAGSAIIEDTHKAADGLDDGIKELSAGEISAICSSLAKGCEKQRLTEEMAAFNELADYFKTQVSDQGTSWDEVANELQEDMAARFERANAVARADEDRGALRSLVWSEKVSMMAKSLLERFAREGDAMLLNTKIFVCDICGLIMVGDVPPEICPVCKVPRFNIVEIERR
ncbi:MAG: rubredoxin [Peptococcaceae bacterium]|nr:rubredoxin [Peptococcaceae bacterium]